VCWGWGWGWVEAVAKAVAACQSLDSIYWVEIKLRFKYFDPSRVQAVQYLVLSWLWGFSKNTFSNTCLMCDFTLPSAAYAPYSLIKSIEISITDMIKGVRLESKTDIVRMNGVFFSPDRIPVHFVLFAG